MLGKFFTFINMEPFYILYVLPLFFVNIFVDDPRF